MNSNDEDDFYYEEEVEESIDELQQESKINIDRYSNIIAHNNSINGLDVQSIVKCITIDKSQILNWDHVIFTIDLTKLSSIDGEQIQSLVIPNFVEEVQGVLDSELGYNQSIINLVKEVYIPRSVVVLGECALAMYRHLETIEVDRNSNLRVIEQYAISYDKLKEVNISECKKLYCISDTAFYKSKINSLIINDKIQLKDNTGINNLIIKN